MRVLLDTNLLVSLVHAGHVHHGTSTVALGQLAASGHARCVVPQNLYEAWVVVTRPAAANGLGWSAPTALAEMQRVTRLFQLQPDEPGIFSRWQQLVVQYDVSGKPAHDTRLVAAMLVHGIDAILTFNGRDFVRYAGIAVLDPAAVPAGAAP